MKTDATAAQRTFGDARWQQYLKTSRVGETIYFDEGNGRFESGAAK